MSRKLLELLLTFEAPLSIRSDTGGEFTAQVVKNLCQWLKVSIDYGPANNPRAHGANERESEWLQEVLSELCKLGLGYGTRICSPHAGFNVSSQSLTCPRVRHHSVYSLTEMLARLYYARR